MWRLNEARHGKKKIKSETASQGHISGTGVVGN
jgi:hypothetical protein